MPAGLAKRRVALGDLLFLRRKIFQKKNKNLHYYGYLPIIGLGLSQRVIPQRIRISSKGGFWESDMCPSFG